MYPDLSYILHALIGTAPDNGLSIVKTFGLFLILSFLASAYFLQLELKRKEEEGVLKPSEEKIVEGKPASPVAIAWNALLGFILGFKLVYIVMHFQEFQADAAGVLLSGKGVGAAGVLVSTHTTPHMHSGSSPLPTYDPTGTRPPAHPQGPCVNSHL